jgi:hypothetical protein
MMGAMTEPAPAVVRKQGSWATRIVLILAGLLIVVIAYFALASILPVWWANTIRNQVQGNLGAGILVGMFYGFVFTFVPLLVAWQATNKAVKWPWKIAIILLAVALATPNLLTAGILLGSSEAAHNGQRILGTEATWFPMWTQISAVVALVVFIAAVVLWSIWRGRGRKMKVLKKAEAERIRSEAERAKAAGNAPGTGNASDTGDSPGSGNTDGTADA